MSDPARPSKPLRLVVLISGGGSTLQNLMYWLADGRLSGVRIAGVISSRRAVKGNQIAQDGGLPLTIVHPHDHGNDDDYGAAVADAMDAWAPDLVVMGGFLRLWRFPERYTGRVINIHPALLPAYGGAGMYGLRVHAAVLAAQEQHSGCTVHLVDHQFDHGPTVAQAQVAVEAGDTPETLAERVMTAERWLYPWVLGQVADRGVSWLAEAQQRPRYFTSSPFEISSSSEESSSTSS